jgi:hypothetical protein
LFLLGTLYVAYYFARNIEVFSYLFHPDASRKVLIKNHILERMRQPLAHRAFMWFTAWYIIVNGVTALNVLFLEYFIIRVLHLPFFWIPLSFVLMAAGSIAGLAVLKSFFPDITRQQKLILVSFLTVISSAVWLFVGIHGVLIAALLIAGFVNSAVTLSQRVEVINYADGKDKEGYYATFNTAEYVVSAVALLAIGLLQSAAFNFSLIFMVTTPLALVSLVCIRRT